MEVAALLDHVWSMEEGRAFGHMPKCPEQRRQAASKGQA
jgi:hypothetical protein